MKRTPQKKFESIVNELLEEFKYGDRKMLVIKTLTLLLILLYVSGLMSEMINNGQAYITGEYAGRFTFNPIKVLYITFTDGIMGMIIVFSLAGILYYNYLLHSVFEKDEPLDERGFSLGEDSTVGSAKWMTELGIKKNFEYDHPAKVTGTIVGTINKKALAPKVADDRNKNNMIIGAAGTGKSSCFVIPYALQCIKRNESVVFTDPKGELVSMLTPVLEKNGYEIKYFNLKNPEHSDGWDCLGEINNDINFALTFANTIINNTSGNETGFWSDGDLNLLKGLLLKADAEREGLDEGLMRKQIDKAKSISAFPKGTLPRLYADLVDKDNEISNIIDQTDPEQSWYSSFALFSQGSEVVQQSNIFGLGVRLGILQSPSVAKMLSSPDIDLLKPAKEKCAYFLVMDDTDKSLKFISALFFACFFNRIVNFADAQPNKKCPVPVNIILDEFANIGEIPDFPEKLSTSRSRDVNISIICQTMAQLMRQYPEKEWNIIETNCSTKILLGSGDIETNNYFSDLCGYATVKTESQKLNQKTLDLYPLHQNFQESLGDTQRKLLYPDEVNALKGMNMNLIHIVGEDPIKVKKFHFSQHPMGEEIDKNNQMTVEEFITRKRMKQKPGKKEDYFYEVMADLSNMLENDELTLNLNTEEDQKANDEDTRKTEDSTFFEECNYDDYEDAAVSDCDHTNQEAYSEYDDCENEADYEISIEEYESEDNINQDPINKTGIFDFGQNVKNIVEKDF